ncbi:MAG: ferredoxin-type protein NapG [Ignavibacteria bacterium]
MAMRVVVPARRQFLADTARMASGVGIGMLALALSARAARALPPTACRPPGAPDEADFLGACIRCGLCVRDCPPGILALARLGDGVALGTPYFVARSGACEMCENLPCIKACPTGALDHGLTDVAKARMGLAVLVDRGSCLNFLGLRCDVCYRVCPLIDKAITLEPRHNTRTGEHTIFEPVVHADACTGCGKCEAGCVLEKAAIRIYPLALARGEIGGHYRLGWEEKRKAGVSLVAPDAEHRYNLPEGLSYEQGKGVSAAPPAAGVDAVAVPRPAGAARGRP